MLSIQLSSGSEKTSTTDGALMKNEPRAHRALDVLTIRLKSNFTDWKLMNLCFSLIRTLHFPRRFARPFKGDFDTRARAPLPRPNIQHRDWNFRSAVFIEVSRGVLIDLRLQWGKCCACPCLSAVSRFLLRSLPSNCDYNFMKLWIVSLEATALGRL